VRGLYLSSGQVAKNKRGKVLSNLFLSTTEAPRFSVGTLSGKTLLAAATFIALMTAAPSNSRADSIGAAFGAGTGLLVAGPPGAIIGGVVGAVWGHPFWGPPNSPQACWIDNSFYRHCRYYGGRWHHY
jgi:hypothetical protein